MCKSSLGPTSPESGIVQTLKFSAHDEFVQKFDHLSSAGCKRIFLVLIFIFPITTEIEFLLFYF